LYFSEKSSSRGSGSPPPSSFPPIKTETIETSPGESKAKISQAILRPELRRYRSYMESHQEFLSDSDEDEGFKESPKRHLPHHLPSRSRQGSREEILRDLSMSRPPLPRYQTYQSPNHNRSSPSFSHSDSQPNDELDPEDRPHSRNSIGNRRRPHSDPVRWADPALQLSNTEALPPTFPSLPLEKPPPKPDRRPRQGSISVASTAKDEENNVHDHRSRRPKEHTRYDKKERNGFLLNQHIKENGGSDSGSERRNSQSSVIHPQVVKSNNLPFQVIQSRTEWQTMLSSALNGDVIRSEKRRLGSAEQNRKSDDGALWLALRAKLRGRTIPEEKRRVEALRSEVSVVLEEVLRFEVSYEPDAPSPYEQVVRILDKVDKIENLYPSRTALIKDKPEYASLAFRYNLDALNSWLAMTKSLKLQLQILKNWTGSEDLLISRNDHPLSSTDEIDNQPFIERVLKESGVKATFEKRIMSVLRGLLAKTKASMTDNAAAFHRLGLPINIDELQKLASFPPNLMEEFLKVRLRYSKRLDDKNSMIMMDQIIEDFSVSLSLAVRIKQDCLELNREAPGWTITNRYFFLFFSFVFLKKNLKMHFECDNFNAILFLFFILDNNINDNLGLFSSHVL